MTAQIFVGTAGWAIPRESRGAFPNGDSILARYAKVFDAVEINSSFYRSHRPATYARWSAAVPDRFRFAVKAPKAVTHEKRLIDVVAHIDAFLEQTAGLGHKRGPLLVQLPPSLVFDDAVAGRFFSDLRARTNAPVVCEPRHASWFDGAATAVLTEHRIARVAADPAKLPEAAACGGWPGLRYTRLHGSPRIYTSSYDDAALDDLAATLTETRQTTHQESWVIFDNTTLGAACANALDLRACLGLS